MKRIITFTLAILTLFMMASCGKAVTSIFLNEQSLTLEEDEEYKLVCTVNPGDAKGKTVEWTSSNDTVARVSSDGEITALKEGTCIITVTSSNGLSDSCRVTVNAKIPNMRELFSEYESEDWCQIASDGSYIKIDTNPENDEDDSYAYLEWMLLHYSDCDNAIKDINKKLGFSDAIYERMNTTTALQGRQQDENSNYKVSWTYHPNNGLEVLYEMKNNK